MDYYSILGVSRTASETEIKTAFRKLAAKHHPDKGGDHKKFIEIKEAYETLSDPQKRAAYDNPQPQSFSWSTNQQGFNPFEEIFGQQFGYNPFGGQRPQRKNHDIRVNVDLTLEEVFSGKEIRISYRSQSGHDIVHDINLPVGIPNGQTIRFRGLGDNSIPGIPPGDLYAKIQIRTPPNWSVDGLNLNTTVNVDFFDLLLGTEVNINVPGGKALSLKIPAGTQPTTTFSIHGHGIPNNNNGTVGTIFVKLKTLVPKIKNEGLLEKIREIKKQAI